MKSYEIESFGLPMSELNANIKKDLGELYREYLLDIERNANVRQTEKYANIDSFVL